MFAYCANNPVCNKDTCGALYERTSGGGGGGGNGFLWIGEPTGGRGGGGYYPIPSATATLGALAFSALCVSGFSTEAIRAETIARKSSRGYCVYTLTNPTTTKVEYVGRTKNPDIRKDAHSRSAARGHLEFNTVASDLDYATARGMEQVLMLYHHTLNRENAANNQINGISPYNPQVDIYMDAAVKYLKYADNQISNDILNFLGI